MIYLKYVEYKNQRFLVYEKIYLKIGKYKIILLYIFILFVVKIIPLFTIKKDKLKVDDFLNLCVLFLIYNIWLFIQNQNIFEIQDKIFHAILYDTKETPLIYMLHK